MEYNNVVPENQLILDAMLDGYILADKEGRITDVNRAYVELSGYSREELLSMNIHELEVQIPPGEVGRRIQEMIRAGRDRFETMHRRKDGEILHLDTSISILQGMEKPLVAAFMRDITVSKKANETLMESELFLRETQKVAALGTYSMDFKTGLWKPSSILQDIFGIDDGYLTDVPGWLQIVHPEDRETMQDYLETHVLGRKEPFNREYRISRFSDREERWVHGMGKLELDEKGNPAKLIGTIQDITDRKQAEQNLILAMEKAKESDRLKSKFLATMSHELRTPLNSIIGFSDIISEELDMHEIIEYAGIINSSGNQLLSIVEDLFDITLIDTGQMKIRSTEEDLGPILKYVYEIIEVERISTGKDHLEFKMELPGPGADITLNTDAGKLKQILINLLKNALKYTEQGYVHSGYEVVKGESGRQLRFFVKDTGIGISPDQQDMIFEIFRQVDDSPTRQESGTGIGLSIARKLTELLGGEIGVDSKEGEGSVFYFTLPYPDQEPGDGSGNETGWPERSGANGLEGRLVLVVEDDEPSFTFLKILLEQLGIQLIWADSGLRAVEYCKSNPDIEMVLMDINMPGMNGYETTGIIKAFNPGLPIVAQTAYAVSGDKEKALEAGCDDYITKPINKSLLLEKVRKFLS